MQEAEAYITIKDHKEDFPNKISCRFINLSKSSIVKISKVILNKINNIVSTKSFIVFNIESFYPSISEDLFKSAIQFAK